MTRTLVLSAAALSGLAAGCCDQTVVARAFVGHKSLAECKRALNVAEAPVSIVCPGTEVTICWGSKNTDKVEIAVSPDPDGASGPQEPFGAIYLKPRDNTTVELTGTDCGGTKKQIQVINGPTPATFDASWDAACSLLSYQLDPAFVDPLVQTTDVTAQWEPQVRAHGGPQTCPTPPFLDGAHIGPPSPPHFFSIATPFLAHPFSAIQPAINDWRYTLKACDGLGFKCEANASLPFEMTLVCPAS
jgi:hypothetical protein